MNLRPPTSTHSRPIPPTNMLTVKFNMFYFCYQKIMENLIHTYHHFPSISVTRTTDPSTCFNVVPFLPMMNHGNFKNRRSHFLMETRCMHTARLPKCTNTHSKCIQHSFKMYSNLPGSLVQYSPAPKAP